MPQIEVERTRASTSPGPGLGDRLLLDLQDAGLQDHQGLHRLGHVLGLRRVVRWCAGAPELSPASPIIESRVRRRAVKSVSIIDEAAVAQGPVVLGGERPGSGARSSSLTDSWWARAASAARSASWARSAVEDRPVLQHDLADVDAGQGERDEGPGEGGELVEGALQGVVLRGLGDELVEADVGLGDAGEVLLPPGGSTCRRPAPRSSSRAAVGHPAGRQPGGERVDLRHAPR